jgi:site-specific DNA recombinase
MLKLKPVPQLRLRCAVYCRVSAEDARDTKNKSVEHQRQQAIEYAKRKGWAVRPECVFTDDGISGGEYVNRPGFTRLLASLPKRGKPPFDVLVMSEASRLGRDMLRNAACVVEIIESGVQIWYYLSDEQEHADTPEQRVMVTLRSYASEVERLKAGQRARTVLAAKAKQGFSTGGACFGYDTFDVNGTNGAGEVVRSHVDYKINDQQAEVVRGIFKMYLSGFGHASVAKCLNGQANLHAQSRKFFNGQRPDGPRTGSGSWAPSRIRAMLSNERYAGRVPYGSVRRIYKSGTKKRVRDGQTSFAERPDLRIVSKDLWEAVQKRLKSVRQTYVRETGGTLWGRPETGAQSKYLLSGLARCGLCGASMIATKGLGRGRQMYARYACSHNSNRGRTVCENNYRESQESLDNKVIDAVERTVLTPERVDRIIQLALQKAKERSKQEPDSTKKLEADIKRLERERDNLTAACAQGRVKPESLLAEIERREHAIATLKADLARSPHRLRDAGKNMDGLKASMLDRIGKFRELMRDRRNAPLARQALRKLLDGPIRCTPVVRKDGRRGYAIRGETRLGALLSGACVTLVPRKGLEPPQCCHR